jgi:DNA polymerase alpha-associated DNA helicase A
MDSTLRHLSRLVLSPELIQYGALPPSASKQFVEPGLLSVLFGLKEPGFEKVEIAEGNSEVKDDGQLRWFDETLNDSQKEAVRFVLGMKEVGCIHGPPGVSFYWACDLLKLKRTSIEDR